MTETMLETRSEEVEGGVCSVLETPPFELLLKIVLRNSPMPIEPKPQSIVGKHGMIVELDPRRIRHMQKNPRWATNPGFKPEKLRELGESMQIIGQMHAIQVCPIVGDPDFDAQCIDGERRLRGGEIVKIMLKAGVREDVTPDMLDALWLLSVASNSGSEPPTTLELVHIVSRLRGEQYRMTFEQVAKTIGRKIGVVQRLAILARLHPEVQMLLDDSPPEPMSDEEPNDRVMRDRSRKLTSQLALLLADLPQEVQLKKAETIVLNRMTYTEARRFVLNERREAGIRVVGGKTAKKSKWFEALSTLARQNTQAFGIYLDMTPKEITEMKAASGRDEQFRVTSELRFLANCLNDIAKKVDPQRQS